MSQELRRPHKERRHLTVMFVDLVGSTTIVDSLDPEDAQEVFDAFTDLCTQIITDRGGYVARIEGDGVLAYFGFPTAREDASEQAVRAGLAIANGVSRIRTSHGIALNCRTGIASGSVLVGEAHTSGGSIFYEVIGRAPHVARRLQEQVAPGEVGISDAIHRQAGGFFICAPHPPVRLKGFRHPEMFWRVREQRAIPLRLLARDSLQRCAFVGRAEELSVLQRLWDGAMRGEGGAVGIIGPAGIGKSRIAYEFVHAVSEDGPHVLLLQGNAHHRHSAWQPLREELTRHLDQTTPTGGSRMNTLAHEISAAPTDRDIDDARMILQILDDEPTPSTSSRPAEERVRIVSALVRRLQSMAASKPTVVVVEDVHWLDESTTEWVHALVRGIATRPMLVILTGRDRVAGDIGVDMTELVLGGLTDADARAMVDQLVEEKPFAQLSTDDVLGKAGGIPLFIEEYISHRVDRLAAKASNVPDRNSEPDTTPNTLMDLLGERIDEVGPGKAFLQACSVCGEAFDLRLVARAVSIDESRAISIISDLESRGILASSAEFGDEFRFRHALLRDASYASLLKSERASLHAKIAETMEGGGVHGNPAAPEVLAWHFSEASNPEKCLAYRIAAADKFKAQYAAAESLHQLELAAATVEGLEDAARRREWQVRLYNLLGATRSIFFGWGDQTGQEYFEKALSLTTSSDDRRTTFDSVRGLWNVNMIQGNFPIVAVLTRQLTAIADSADDAIMQVDAANANGAYRLWLGDFVTARGHFEEAIRLYESIGTRRPIGAPGTDPGIVALCLSAWNSWFLGDRDAALRTIDVAKDRARGIDHAFGLAYAFSISASIWQTDGDPERARAEAEQSVAIAGEHRSDMKYWIDRGGILIGWATSMTGDPREGIARMNDSIDSYRVSGGGQLLPYARTLLAEGLLAAEAVEDAETELVRAGEVMKSEHPHYYDSERLRLLGEARIRRGQWSEGAAVFAAALTVADSFRSPPLRKAVLRSQARLQPA